MKIGKTGIRVIDAMTKKPVIVGPDLSLINAAKKMLQEEVGSLIIKEKDKPVGILTEKDLIKVIAKKMDTKNTFVREVMNKKLIKIDPNEDIYDAMLKMNEENVRRLPVINKNGNLVGLLTHRDILIMQPTLIDLRLEHLGIREIEEKVKEGECENCGAEGLLYNCRGNLLCRACSY